MFAPEIRFQKLQFDLIFNGKRAISRSFFFQIEYRSRLGLAVAVERCRRLPNLHMYTNWVSWMLTNTRSMILWLAWLPCAILRNILNKFNFSRRIIIVVVVLIIIVVVRGGSERLGLFRNGDVSDDAMNRCRWLIIERVVVYWRSIEKYGYCARCTLDMLQNANNFENMRQLL